MRNFISLCAVLPLFAAVLGSSALAAPAAATSSGNAVQDASRASVMAAESRLGTLEPWQKKIFDEEVVTQSTRFVKEYKSGAATADVDLETIRKYLQFYAPKALVREGPKLIIATKVDAKCPSCLEAALPIKKLARARAERRGFVPILAAEEDLGTGKTLCDRAQTLMTEKKASGVMGIEWRQVPTDDLDTAHADEKRFEVKSCFYAGTGGGESGKAVREFRHSDRIELLENDSMETAAARLLTDTFTAVGEKALEVPSADSANEILLSIRGIRDFAHYGRVKERVQTALAGVGNLEERKISRGQVLFSLRTGRSFEDIQKLVSTISLPTGRLHLMESDGKTLTMEIK